MRKILFFISFFIGCMNIINGGSLTEERQLFHQWEKIVKKRTLLLEGIYFKETRCGKYLSSEASIKEGSVGPLQIGKGMVDYINIKCKTHFTYEDRRDFRKSAEMFFLYQDLHNSDYNIDLGAHIWNAGHGKVKSRWGLTEKYRKELKNYLGNRLLS